MFSCPLCQQSLQVSPQGMVCANNHQFDRAKEGYINLLPVQHKGSKQPGDSKEMMMARRAFLDEQHYQPLREAVTQRLSAIFTSSDPVKLLDLGCGEGYYTSAFHFAPHISVTGIDISKLAVKVAAKRYRDIQFYVASSYRLPLADNTLDAVVRIYAPSKAEELTRVLKTGGYLLTVTPGPRHLYQFKEMIYDQVQLHQEHEHELSAFKLIDEQRIAFDMQLSSQTAVNLLQMTPFAWRATSEVWQRLSAGGGVSIEADFCLRVWQKQ